MIKYQKRLCIHHQQQFIYFCESCLQLICSKCTIAGPHNNQLHIINHINQTYKLKVVQISEAIGKTLNLKRQQIFSQINRLEYRLQQIKYVQDSIKKEYLSFSTEQLQKLNKATQQKNVLLKRDIQILQRSLASINDIGHFFQQIIQEQNTDKEIQLLLNYKNLQKSLKNHVDSIYEPHINVFAQDLPKTLSQLRFELKKVSAYQQMNQLKLKALSTILQNRFIKCEQAKQQDNRYFSQKHEYWLKKAQQNMNQLTKYLLICHFCGTQPNQSNINQQCPANLITGDILNKNFKGYCKQQPEHQFLATARHYFGIPRQFPNGTDGATSQIYVQNLLMKLKILIKKADIDIKRIFQNHDKKKSGLIKQLQLHYILRQECKLEENEAVILVKMLPKKTNQCVEYQKIISRII